MKKSLISTVLLFWGLFVMAQTKGVYPDYYPCRAEEDGKWGYVDKNDSWVIRPIYDALLYETNGGMYPVSMNGKWGLVGPSGETLVDIKYDAVVCEIDYQKYRYPANFAALRQRGKWAFVNVQGIFVTEFVYDEVLILNGKYIIRQKNGKGKMRSGYLDKEGKEVWEN